VTLSAFALLPVVSAFYRRRGHHNSECLSTPTAVCSSHLVRLSEDSFCLMRHTVKVVYGMDSGIRKRLFHSSSSETCSLGYTWTLHCLQAAFPASVSPSLLFLFGVTRRLMVPTGSISCSRTKKQLLF